MMMTTTTTTTTTTKTMVEPSRIRRRQRSTTTTTMATTTTICPCPRRSAVTMTSPRMTHCSWLLLLVSIFAVASLLSTSTTSVDAAESAEALSLLQSGSSSLTTSNNNKNNNINKKKVLVTGGAGFVGSHVADVLLARGDDVVIVDEMNDYYPVSIKQTNLDYLQEKQQQRQQQQQQLAGYTRNNNTMNTLTFYRGDFCNVSFIEHVFEVEQPRWIVHMGARAGVRPSIQDPFIYIHSNIEGTVRLMELARSYSVENFVMASSSSVYGGSSKSLFDESDRTDQPISPYAATKKACELFGYTWHHLYRLPVTALRFFTVYGPRGRPDMAPYKFIQRVSAGHTIQQYGNGSSSRDYTYIDDIVNGVVRSLDQPHEYEIFNLGKGHGTRLTDFVDLVQQNVGKPATIEILPDQPGDVPYTCANVTKAHVMLGYTPSVTMEEGIKRTVEWYKTAFPQLQQSRRRLRHLAAEVEGDLDADLDNDDNSFDGEGEDEETRQVLDVGPTTPSNEPTPAWTTVPVVPPHTGKKKVLVTGAAGFIGSHVADFLLARGDDVIIVDEVNDYYNVSLKEANLAYLTEKYGDHNDQQDPNKPRLIIYRGDIADAVLMRHIFETERPAWVCHMAARAGVRPSIQDPFVYVHSNIRGTTQLMELSREFGVRNFVFASSSSVYGGSTSTYFSEEEVIDYPISPYAASKKACELLGYTYHHLYGLNVTGLRFFTVYGPRGRPDMAPYMFIDRVSTGSVLKQFGDGSSSRDYTYIDDIVDGVVRAVDRPYPYQLLNLGKGSGTKLNEFIDLVQKYTGKQANIQYLPDQPGDVPYTCADVRKAEYLLGYRSKVDIDNGIRRTVEWYQEAYGRGDIEPSSDPAIRPPEDEDSQLPVGGAATVRPLWQVDDKQDVEDLEDSNEELESEDESRYHDPSNDTYQDSQDLSEEDDEDDPVRTTSIKGFVPSRMSSSSSSSSSSNRDKKVLSGASEEDFFFSLPEWVRQAAFLQWFLLGGIIIVRFGKVILLRPKAAAAASSSPSSLPSTPRHNK